MGVGVDIKQSRFFLWLFEKTPPERICLNSLWTCSTCVLSPCRSGPTFPPWGSTRMENTSWPSWRSTTWRMASTWVLSAAPLTASCKNDCPSPPAWNLVYHLYPPLPPTLHLTPLKLSCLPAPPSCPCQAFQRALCPLPPSKSYSPRTVDNLSGGACYYRQP